MLRAGIVSSGVAHLRRTVDQSTSLALSSRVEFDKIESPTGNISLDTLTNVGRVTVRAPGRYFMFGRPQLAYADKSGSFPQASPSFRWYNVTTAAYTGTEHYMPMYNQTSSASTSEGAVAFIVLTAGDPHTELELRVNATNAAWAGGFFTAAFTMGYVIRM